MTVVTVQYFIFKEQYYCTLFTTTDYCRNIYMIDSDRRPVSNRCPLLKSASTDAIIPNHGPILGYSQTRILSKLSYLLARLYDISLPSEIIVMTVLFF